MSKTLKILVVILGFTLLWGFFLVFPRYRPAALIQNDLATWRVVYAQTFGRINTARFPKTQLEICDENTTEQTCDKIAECKWRHVCITTLDCGFGGQLDYAYHCIASSTKDYAREIKSIEYEHCMKLSKFECMLNTKCEIRDDKCSAKFLW